MNEQAKLLIQVAVAYATGCNVSMKQHVAKAKEAGITQKELEETVQLVRQVRLTAMMDADTSIQDAVESDPVADGSAEERSSCGCGSGKCC